MAEDRLIEEAARLIGGARHLVAFSGAGISEESGIPTFRDPGGLWDRYNPSELGSGDIFGDALSGSPIPDATFQFVSELITCFEETGPNPGHEALARLEEMGILKAVVTQNIDNLHRLAGNSNVIEVHGNVYRLACLACGNKILLDREEFLTAGRELVDCLERKDVEGLIKLASRCGCGGVCRLDVVNFGEPVQDLHKAVQEARICDLMLILGTSGVVWPAASVPGHAKKAGAKLVEINATACCFPDIIDVGIIGKTGETLPRMVELVSGMR